MLIMDYILALVSIFWCIWCDKQSIFIRLIQIKKIIFCIYNRPYFVVLGRLPETELYKDVEIYKDVRFLWDVFMFYIINVVSLKNKLSIACWFKSLHNTNAAFFKKKVYECTSTNPQEYISRKLKLERKNIREADRDIPIIIKVLISNFFSFLAKIGIEFN